MSWRSPRPATTKQPLPSLPPSRLPAAHQQSALTGAARRHPPPCPARRAAGGSGSCRVGAGVGRGAPPPSPRPAAGSPLGRPWDRSARDPRGKGLAVWDSGFREEAGRLGSGASRGGASKAGPMRMGPGAAAAGNGSFRGGGRGRGLGAGHEGLGQCAGPMKSNLLSYQARRGSSVTRGLRSCCCGFCHRFQAVLLCVSFRYVSLFPT